MTNCRHESNIKAHNKYALSNALPLNMRIRKMTRRMLPKKKTQFCGTILTVSAVLTDALLIRDALD